MRFYAELGDFLSPSRRGREFECPLGGRRSVKDLIEGLGVPHTEVDLVLVNGQSVDFSYRLSPGDRISVYPVFEALDIAGVTAVRPQPLRLLRFLADVHLGRLAGYLRLAGFDTLYDNSWDDEQIAETAVRERRVLLTRDRGLLMRSVVSHGYLVRSARPREQLREVLDRFDLWGAVRPLSRCSVCNVAVAAVERERVIERLPPRTAAHYQEFWLCPSCGRIYWRGAHYRSLMALLCARSPSAETEERPPGPGLP